MANKLVPELWQYELARSLTKDGEYTAWDEEPRVANSPPDVPEGSVRNLKGLVPVDKAKERIDEIRQEHVKAMQALRHSVSQALVPGNDVRRELLLMQDYLDSLE